jgi:hypothetical protein
VQQLITSASSEQLRIYSESYNVVSIDNVSVKQITYSALGPELVSNGSFASGVSGWKFGDYWSINPSETAGYAGRNGAIEAVEQYISASSGQIYLASLTVGQRTSGYVVPVIGGTSGSNIYDNGTAMSQLIKAQSSGNLRIVPSYDFDGYIDTLSVKLISGGDLDVAGNATIYRTLTMPTANYYTSGIKVGLNTYLYDSGVIIGGSGGPLGSNAGLQIYYKALTIGNPTTSGAIGNIHIWSSGASDTYEAITFGGSTIYSGGQAGIYVKTNASTGSSMYLGTTNSWTSGSQMRVIIDQNGNTGIMSLIPAGRLDVRQTASAYGVSGLVISSASGYGGNTIGVSIEFRDVSVRTGHIEVLYDGTNTNMYFGGLYKGTGGSSNVQMMTLTASGRLGIGTGNSTPQGTLHVSGYDGGTSDYADNIFRYNNSGNKTNIYGMLIYGPSGAGTITNSYGLYVEAPTVGTNKYSLYLGGNTLQGATTSYVVTSGMSIACGSGGNYVVSGGISASSVGGYVALYGGSGASSANGGDAFISGGYASGGTNAAGSAKVLGGSGYTGGNAFASGGYAYGPTAGGFAGIYGGSGANSGGNSYVYGGSGSISGGSVYLTGASATASAGTYGGNVVIGAGLGYTAGAVSIFGGSGYGGGNIMLSGGGTPYAQTAGGIVLYGGTGSGGVTGGSISLIGGSGGGTYVSGKFSIVSGAASGSVLVSDVNGLATWTKTGISSIVASTAAATTILPNTCYVALGASNGYNKFTLSGTYAVGDVIKIVGFSGAYSGGSTPYSGWQIIIQEDGCAIHYGDISGYYNSTTSQYAFVSSTYPTDCVELVCVGSSPDKFVVSSSTGNISIRQMYEP